MAKSGFRNISVRNAVGYVFLTIGGTEYRLRKGASDHNTTEISTQGSFQSIRLVQNVLRINQYSFVLNGYAVTPNTHKSAFKNISITVDGLDTILTVGNSVIVVTDSDIETVALATSLEEDLFLATDDGYDLYVLESLE